MYFIYLSITYVSNLFGSLSLHGISNYFVTNTLSRQACKQQTQLGPSPWCFVWNIAQLRIVVWRIFWLPQNIKSVLTLSHFWHLLSVTPFKMLLDSSINWSFCHISIFEISNIQINLCPAGNDSSSSCASFVVDPFSYNFFVFMIVTNVSFCWNFLVLWFHMNLQPNHVFLMAFCLDV